MPLLLFPFILLYLFAGISISYVYVNKQKTIKRKWGFGILLPTLFFVGPFSDEFIARTYFYSLCNTEGGVKVYKPVYLSEKYFDENNKLIFISDAKDPSTFKLLNRYKGHNSSVKEYDSPFNIRWFVESIKDEKSGDIISEHRTFLYGYGYVINKLSVAMPGQPISCHHYWKEKEYIEFFEKTFKKKL